MLRPLSLACLLSLSLCSTFALAEDSGKSTNPTSAFNNLDQFFVKNYGAAAKQRRDKERPLIVSVGFSIYLLCEDGTTKTISAAKQSFDQLKAVAHIGPAIYALALPHWNDPKNTTWLESIKELEQKIELAQAQVDSIDWSSDAWPGGEAKLKQFVKDCLQKAKDTTSGILAKKEFTRQQYAHFAQSYEPNMSTCFYLSTLGDAYDTIKTLKQWKKEIGEEKWSHMFAIVGGSQGRATAGLTWDTNPVALFIGSLMTKEQAATHIIMAPTATTIDDAIATGGNPLIARDLAWAMFPTPEAQKKTGFYEALYSFDKPIALEFVKKSLLEIKDGKSTDPLKDIHP
jgi:hypothetical protein